MLDKSNDSIRHVFYLGIFVTLLLIGGQRVSTNPFRQPAYIEAKYYVTQELISHPETLTVTGCVDGVAFTLANMPDMAEQYIRDFPECTTALLNKHKMKNHS